jgi:hypothetical protein
MTVREFSTGDVILLDEGELDAVLGGAFSICAVVYRTSETDYTNIIGFLTDASSNRGGLWLTPTGLVQVVCSGFDAEIAGLDVPLNKWVYIGIDKADGDSVSPRGHLKNLTDNAAISHATASGTVNEDSGTTTIICIGKDHANNDYSFPGRIAGISIKAASTWSDAEHAENAAGFQAMIDNGATDLWALQQTGTPPAIVNDEISGRTANQTNQGSDGTIAVAGSDPENFDLTIGGGTDLPYDGEGETLLVQDAPARATLDEAFGADGTTPRLQDTPARAGFDIPYGADQIGARALTAAPASAGTGVGGLADQAGARAGVQPARAALAVATASDARGGAPVPSTARGAVSVAISTDSVGARPALGLAVSQLNESGAEDLLYTSDTVAARALTAQARSALDEMFRAIPHLFHLADAPARSEAGIAYGADYRVPLTLRNAAARVLANQSALGRMSVPLLGRGLAAATLGTGQPLPVDVFANMGPLTVSGSFAPLSVKAKFGGSSVAGWVP